MRSKYVYFLILSAFFLLAGMYWIFIGDHSVSGPYIVGFFVFLALGVRELPVLRGFAFAFWILSAVSVAMYYPAFLLSWGSFQLKTLIIPLLQVIMFGMGTAMSLRDFGEVVRRPRAVLIGLACQFTIMPLIGLLMATLLDFPLEIAAGVVLIGSSPSGLASNVMTYIARANLALSVTLTTVATLLAPIMTPLLMRLLAGQFVPVDVWSMMWGIVKIVILPIVAGLVFNRLLHGKTRWLDDTMPRVSMVSIAIVIAVITASGRDALLQIGLALIFASIVHNCSGYVLGYWVCRLFRMDEASCRTIAIEVGMQNGGLASGIALQMGKVASVGLAPAVFGPMMNITGSSLASWWRERPITSAPVKVDNAGN